MANSLTRWDPTADFAAMRNVMDRLFEQPLARFPFRASEDLGTTSLNLDVVETGDTFIIKAAIPGVEPKDVEISVDDDILTISGEFSRQEESNDSNYLRREIRYGSFQRQLRLPPTVEAEKAQAHFENGLLKLTLPKKSEARARSIKITANGVIDAPAENSQN